MNTRLVLVGALGLVLCAPMAQAAEEKEQTPVEYYRKQSFSLTSGMTLAGVGGVFGGGWTGFETQFGNTSAVGLISIGAAARAVFSGFVIGAEFGALFIDGLISNTVLLPGVSVGYAIPLMDRLALTPSFHTVFLISTASNSSASIQMTGEVGLEIFLGKHGFIEPLISMGDLQNTGVGQGTFIFGVGYRLGVVF